MKDYKVVKVKKSLHQKYKTLAAQRGTTLEFEVNKVLQAAINEVAE